LLSQTSCISIDIITQRISIKAGEPSRKKQMLSLLTKTGRPIQMANDSITLAESKV
jgi:hypothetical protein